MVGVDEVAPDFLLFADPDCEPVSSLDWMYGPALLLFGGCFTEEGVGTGELYELGGPLGLL